MKTAPPLVVAGCRVLAGLARHNAVSAGALRTEVIGVLRCRLLDSGAAALATRSARPRRPWPSAPTPREVSHQACLETPGARPVAIVPAEIMGRKFESLVLGVKHIEFRS
jgi:hypothetical protein